MVYDHNWDEAEYPINVYNSLSSNSNNNNNNDNNNKDAMDIVSGAAFHCYAGKYTNQSIVHELYSNKEIYFSECSGFGTSNFKGNIPWNTRHLYEGSVNNWSTMVLHWNLVLDQNSGPHNGGCSNCRGIVTLNSNTYDITYNEEWYGIIHFGKFVSNTAGNSKLISVNWDYNGHEHCINGIAITSDNNNYNIILSNFCDTNVFVAVEMESSKNYVNISLPLGLSTLYGAM